MSHSRRFDSLLPKLLTKVINEAVAQGRTVDGNFVDAAQRILAEKLAQGTITDKEIRQIVLLSAPRSASAQPPEPAAAKATSSLPAVQSNVDRRDEAAQQQEARPTAKSTTPAPLFNTTKRQRQLLADQEWISQAERDRENAAIGRIQERVEKVTTQSNQRSALDRQMSEWEAQKAEERRLKRKAQDDMTRAIAEAREAARQERENAFQKAQKEKRFREQQAADLERAREEQRVQEHNDQIRHMMMLQAEMQRQREEEIAQKLREQQEWKQVLAENAKRLQEKSVQKEQQRAEDRHFQRIYVENLEREERERAQVKARKEARAAMFQAMANTVATMHMKKVQNVDDKIEAEYEEQLRRAQEDELNRKNMAKQRILETQRVLEVQKAQLKEQRDREREEAKQLADAMARQAKEAELQERNRKLAARAEAARMKEFLSTQLQLQHFRETRPLETSITRPESRAATMYSPSRYTPSPKPL